MDNAFGLTFSNEYDEDGRIELDPKMAGSDSDVRTWTYKEKIDALSDLVDWAETDKDWLAKELDDYFTQIFEDNGFRAYSDFFRDKDIVDVVFQKVFKALPESSYPIEESKAKTAICPNCGNKYLVNTGYCVSCKKKVAKTPSEKKENIMIEIKEEVKIGDIILEAGDKIKVLKERSFDEEYSRDIKNAWKNFLEEKITDLFENIAMDFDESLSGKGQRFEMSENDVEQIEWESEFFQDYLIDEIHDKIR